MNIDLYSDPSCPWCWTASQWLRAAATSRDLDLKLRPFSLALLGKPAPPEVVACRTWAQRALRVSTALDDDQVGNFLDLFSEALFGAPARPQEPDLSALLEQSGSPRELAEVADEIWRDDLIWSSMETAARCRGLALDDSTSVPILVLNSESGPIAVDGPLVDPVPRPSEAAALWDAFERTSTTRGMFGATRPRRGPHSSVAAYIDVAQMKGQAS